VLQCSEGVSHLLRFTARHRCEVCVLQCSEGVSHLLRFTARHRCEVCVLQCSEGVSHLLRFTARHSGSLPALCRLCNGSITALSLLRLAAAAAARCRRCGSCCGSGWTRRPRTRRAPRRCCARCRWVVFARAVREPLESLLCALQVGRVCGGGGELGCAGMCRGVLGCVGVCWGVLGCVKVCDRLSCEFRVLL
jgi:hypothetical protein